MSETTTPTTPFFAVSNIINSPGTTLAGIGIVLAAVQHALPGGQFPTTTAGWITFAVSVLTGVSTIFAK